MLRAHAGTNLLYDAALSNVRFAAAAAICLLRQDSDRVPWRLVGAGFALFRLRGWAQIVVNGLEDARGHVLAGDELRRDPPLPGRARPLYRGNDGVATRCFRAYQRTL